MNKNELKKVYELLDELRGVSPEDSVFKRASDFMLIESLIQCAIIKTKEQSGFLLV